MSRRFMKVLVIGATVASALVSASTASAVNWSSNGSAAPGTAFSATAPTSRFEINVTNPSHQVGLSCSNATMTGRVFGPTGPSNTGAWNSVATLQPSYSSCTAAGQTGVMSCAEEQFDAVSQTSQVVTGNIRGINCTFTFWGCVLTFAGNLTGNTYNNITAVLTRSVSAGLNASWPNTAACRSIMGTTGGGTAPMTWGTSTSPPAPLSYTVTSVFKPSIQHN